MLLPKDIFPDIGAILIHRSNAMAHVSHLWFVMMLASTFTQTSKVRKELC